MAWNGRKTERRKEIEGEEKRVEAGEGLVGKDVARVDLSVLVTSSRGKRGPRGAELGRLVRAGFEKKKRERFKAGAKKRSKLAAAAKLFGATGWENRKMRPWRRRDDLIVGMTPGARMSIGQITETTGIRKGVMAPILHQVLFPGGLVGKERFARIPPVERFYKRKGYEVEWWLTAAGEEERERLIGEREAAELEEMMA